MDPIINESDTLRVNDQEKKKRYLKRYKRNKALIDRLEDKLFRLDDKLMSVGSPSLSAETRGTASKTREDIILDKLEIEERINRLVLKGKKLKRETIELIDTLEDPTLCEILESFFIDCMSIDDIADELGYTNRHITRLYSIAIARLVLPDDVGSMSVTCR